MTDKFTPGPWRAVGRIKGHNLAMWIFAKDPSPDTDRELQVFSLLDSHVDKGHLIRRQADMRLIASAPELYKALQEILKEVEMGIVHTSARYIKSVAKKALKKATKPPSPPPQNKKGNNC